MKNISNLFKRIKDNSIWVYNDDLIVVYKTKWKNMCPIVLFYKMKDLDNSKKEKPQLDYVNRFEFLLNAKENIEK